MSEKIEQLEEQVAELEQQVENLFEQLAESKERIAEEALLAGYELGYLQAVVNRTEKELFLEQASSSFDEVMAAPEVLDTDSLAELLTEIDTFDDVFVSNLDEEAQEDDQFALMEEEATLLHAEDLAPVDNATQAEVIAAVQGWLGQAEAQEELQAPAAEPVVEVAQQEELELV